MAALFDDETSVDVSDAVIDELVLLAMELTELVTLLTVPTVVELLVVEPYWTGID